MLDLPRADGLRDRDTRAPLPVAEALHTAIPGTRLVVRVGHVSWVEAPRRITDAIRPVLGRTGS